MDTNTTYRYREESAPEGYGYSEMIEFTLNPDGMVTGAHYINEKGEPILFDKDGFPTTRNLRFARIPNALTVSRILLRTL